MPSAASSEHGDAVVAAAVQQAGDGLADVAGSEQGDLHGIPPYGSARVTRRRPEAV
jgi:hypothetical protein